MLTNWLVHDRMPMGGVTLLVAKPKVGKSTAARDLALAVARGEDWLGHRCSPGVVWYLAFEGRREDIKHHFQQMGATGDEPIYVFIDQPPRDMLNRLATLAANQHPNLIIVDTLQRLIQAKDMADYGEMTTRLTPLLTLAAQSNATVLLLHHAGKGKYEDIDAALGSTAIAGSADNVFLLKRGKHYRTISSIQRVGPDLEETVIELHEHSGRVRLGGSRFEAEVAVATVEILKALQNSGSQQFLSKTDLLEPIEMRRQVKFRALKLLIQQGSIVQLGSGSRSDPHRYCRSEVVPEFPSGSQRPGTTSPSVNEASNKDGNEGSKWFPGSPNRWEPDLSALFDEPKRAEDPTPVSSSQVPCTCTEDSRELGNLGTSELGNSGTWEPETEREPGEEG